jgi:DNA-binding MarR family transcriptional regulator
MANQDGRIGKQAAGAVSDEEAVSAEGFADLVLAMSRLLAGFGQLKPLRDGGLGLGEWAALSAFAREPGLTGKLMGRKLGVPVKRVSQISASLEKSGFISIQQSTEEGKGKEGKGIAITDAGKAKLESVNAALQVALQGALKARSLKSATKSMKPLGRVLKDPDKASKRKAKKEKKLAEGAAAKE